MNTDVARRAEQDRTARITARLRLTDQMYTQAIDLIDLKMAVLAGALVDDTRLSGMLASLQPRTAAPALTFLCNAVADLGSEFIKHEGISQEVFIAGLRDTAQDITAECVGILRSHGFDL